MENLNINNDDNILFKDVVVDKTFIWNRPEQNIIYLLSELIDNSKASYEKMMSHKETGDKLPITVIFNQKLGYIAVKDEAEGFNIQKAIEKIGREEMNVGSTNQYFVGMKSAMNYFGNFSIIISEMIEDGSNVRRANWFIFGKGFHIKGDFDLVPTGKTGSEIYLFKNYISAKNFWLEMNFKEKNDSYVFEKIDFPELDNDSLTEEILNNLKILFPILTSSLFERYSFLVNKYPKIEILFRYFDEEGVDLNFSKSLEIPTGAKVYPKFYTSISKNDWENDRSFSFERLLEQSEKNDVKTFKKNLSSENFRIQLEKLLLKDIRNHFSKVEVGSPLYSREKLGKKIPYKIVWLRYLPKYQFAEGAAWDEYPFAKCLASIFMDSLISGSGTFSHIKFKISNLILLPSPYREISASNSYKDETFDLIFDLNIASKRYIRNTDYPWGSIGGDNFAGFSLVQNNRAIYHGPNFDPLKENYVSWSKEWPSKFLSNELRRGDPRAFPNYYTSKQYPTYVSVGGNNSRWTSKIFGSIILPNSSIFNAGTNKAQISNLKPLEQFVLEVMRDSAINVFSRWVHLFDQQAVVGNPSLKQIKNYKRGNNKERTGIILLDILSTLYNSEEKVINNTEAELQVSNEIDKEDAQIINPKEYDLMQKKNKEEFNLISSILDFLKRAKNNDLSILKIKKIELSEKPEKEIIISLDRTFKNWNQTIVIKFDSSLNKDSFKLNYVLEDWRPLLIIIPLSKDKNNDYSYQRIIIENFQKLYYHLSAVTGFYQISAKKKYNSYIDFNWVENKIKAYLQEALEDFIQAK